MMTVCLCHAAHGLSVVAASRVYSVVKYRLLIAVASLVVEHGLSAHGLQWLQLLESIEHRLSSCGS